MNFDTNENNLELMLLKKAFYDNIETSSQKDLIEIIDIIMNYDIFDFIARLASLNLIIENQNKSLLFDILIAGLLSKQRKSYIGNAKMSNNKFRKIICKLNKLGIRSMIDPAENTFIERIRYYGNHWIFPGINHSPSYCLQGFIEVICFNYLSFDPSFVKTAHELINLILVISDDIVEKLRYNIDSIKHVEESDIVVPASNLSESIKDCVYIDYSLFEKMITDSTMREVFFTDFSDAILDEVFQLECHNFYKCPFLKDNSGKVIILNPSILSSFLIHQLVLLADSYGIKNRLIEEYNNNIWTKCRKDIRQLGHIKINESKYNIKLINNRCRKEEILTVGNNKLLFVHFICDDSENYNSDAMFSKYSVDDNIPTTYERKRYFISKLPYATEENIYQIFIINTFGRVVRYRIEKNDLKSSICLYPYELYCISVNERSRNSFLAQYINSKKRLNTIVSNIMSSELNSIEIYTQNDYSFYLSDDFKPEETLAMFSPGDSLDYVIKAVKKENRHLIDHYDGIHMSDVIYIDAKRDIYIPKNHKNKCYEIAVKFKTITIWFSTNEISDEDEFDIYYSIIDTLSYWIAEAKNIINKMIFNTNTICIKIILTESADEYHFSNDQKQTLIPCFKYEHIGNKILMLWDSASYQSFDEKFNHSEKSLLKSVIEEIEKKCSKSIDIEDINSLFSNPLKKKIFSINVTKSPYLNPTSDNIHIISIEEENMILDEIGAHFLSTSKYSLGKVSDEKRAELANEVVSYLYSILQNEIASTSPDGFFETVCNDLEIVMYNSMLMQVRFAYDIACYPEKKDEMINKYNQTNKSSIALKFLAEYIAATPPKGNVPLGTIQYDRILSICSLIIDWAYKNDLFRYNIFHTSVEFLKSGRIGMSRIENDHLFSINLTAQNKLLESISNPIITTYSPAGLINEYQKELDEAFFDEYNFSFQQFTQIIFMLVELGDTIKSDVKKVSHNIVIETLQQKTEYSANTINSIIDHITLKQRKDFLSPPKPYNKYDVYPWRFNRDLSFTRRPILQHGEFLIWGNRQLYHMWRYTFDLILDGKYKAKNNKLKKLIGKISDRRGNEFNSAITNKLLSIKGLIVREKVSKISGKRIMDSNNNTLGDIDILYIVPEKKKIVVGEVKDFSPAKNPYEMQQEYNRVFVDGNKPCYMTKHKRRVKWIEEHIDDIKSSFNLKGDGWTVKSVMFTNKTVVSNEFYHKNEKIIIFSEITEEIVKSI